MIRVKIEDLLIEVVLKESRDVLEATMAKFPWDLIAQSLISTDIVDIINIFTSQEPAVVGGTCLIKKNLGVVFEELDSAKFGRVLLRMTGLSKLILHKVLPIDLGCAYTLLYL